MEVIDIGYWDKLKEKVGSIARFECKDYSDKFLSRRVEVRLRALNLNSYLQYSKVLESDQTEKEKLLKELTIHVTHFFRDIEFYNAFKDEVIPGIVQYKKSKGLKSIRILSAGCSTGEEPYSIIICFMQKLGLEFDKMDIKVVGIDYDYHTVEQAKKGIYEEPQFRETSSEIKEKYFNKSGEGYIVKDNIKQRAEFIAGDILKPLKVKDIDIIFCRNTVIYFDLEAKSKLYVDFYNLLNSQGFFILGKTETLNGPARETFKVFNARERIYIKE